MEIQARRFDAVSQGMLSLVSGAGHPTLRQGSKGPEVKLLPEKLNAKGFNCGTPDGDFGPKTAAAVKAFQRANGLVADGIVGPKTWEKLGVAPPPPPKPTGFAQKVIAEAAKHLGYREHGNNGNMFSAYFHRPAEPWCADFVSYCATKAGYKLNVPSAQGIKDSMAAHHQWKGRANPKAGDVVVFNWDGGRADHTGFVEKVFKRGGKTYIQTIEGNASNMVKRNTYLANDRRIVGYGTLKA
jgi:hypothetical protein